MNDVRNSVVITSCNSRHYLDPCLKAVISQTHPPGEIVLVDRESTDQGPDLVRHQFPQVHIVQSRRDLGGPRSINEGIWRTTGDMILILTAEVQLEEDYLERLMASMCAPGADRVGSASGKILKMFRGPNVIDSAGLDFDPDKASPYKRGEGAQDNGHFEECQYVFGAAPGAGLYRRRMVEDVAIQEEVLDEGLKSFDEFDLAWRAQLKGWRGMYVPEARATADLPDPDTMIGPRRVRMTADRLVHIYKNVVPSDLQTHFYRFLVNEASRHAKNLFANPGLLLSLPLAFLRMAGVRHKRQIVQRGRRLRKAFVTPDEFTKPTA